MPLSKAKIRWSYLVALLLMLLSYGLIFYVIGNFARETNSLTHSYTVVQRITSIQSDIAEAESGVRGYILTNDYRYLSPYHSASKRVTLTYEQLVELARDDKVYHDRITRLGPLIHRRLETLSTAIRDFQVNGYKVTPEVKAPREANRLMMDSIRLILSQLQDQEMLQLKNRDTRLQGFYSSTSIVTILSLMIALVTIVYSVFIYNRENRAKEKAIRNARSYGQQLEERVVELDRVNLELRELKSIEKFAATGRIARTIAHEVRNPLTNIALASEQIKEITGKQEEAEVLLDMIGRNVNRINQLVSDLLNSTRFAQLEFADVSVNELLDEALELASDRIELKEVQVVKDYESDICPVHVDREKMKIAFLNIIVNALEAMDTKGVLAFRTKKIGERCQIEISDNGVGMDDETQMRLFEPYFTGKNKGNGLGMTNTQNIILNHRGHISLKSAPGQGTTFTITLYLKGEGGDSNRAEDAMARSAEA